jgi:hypothetical protein
LERTFKSASLKHVALRSGIQDRVISTAYKERQMKNEFWTLTSDAHLLRATIDWCMVFGVNSNSTHWKRLSSTNSLTRDQLFRYGLLMTLGISGDQWQKYWTYMKDFRDKYASHRELEFANPVPNFDIALKVAFYYDQWVRKLILPDTIEEPALESFASSLDKTAVLFVES